MARGVKISILLGSLRSVAVFVRSEMIVRHLYLHVPFCPKICPYCSFYKRRVTGGSFDHYVRAVLRELDGRLAGWSRGKEGAIELQPRTIFFGGGTPSVLPMAEMRRLLEGLRARLDLSELREWTLEMNPATVSVEKARLLMELGVNRASMGIQSWDDETLHVLGRIHTKEQAERSYVFLREAGFTNINLDHIFAVPGQSIESWEATLDKTVSMKPDHVSAYNLTYEEDTEFFRKFERGEFTQDADDDAAFFELTAGRLSAAGYPPYEISNFAPAGNECLHNLAYWEGSDYLGLGPSAFSSMGNERWQNIADTDSYIAQLSRGEFPVSFSEDLSEEIRVSEKIAFGLRTRFGVERMIFAPHEEKLSAMLEEGLLQETDNNSRVRLTDRGRLLADAIAAEFMGETQ